MIVVIAAVYSVSFIEAKEEEEEKKKKWQLHIPILYHYYRRPITLT